MLRHRDVLRALMPVELGGAYEADNAIEGDHLDTAQGRAEDLMGEMFGDGTYELLTSWERVYGLTPASDATVTQRQAEVVRKLREKGGQSRAYFISLADALGLEISITELNPFMAGWNGAGDCVYEEETRWIWQVTVANQAIYRFRAGTSVAGERLTTWTAQTALEGIFRRLKPAHSYVIFAYS